ncbi:MAG: flavin reductase family protein, partial [Pseudomonadota bacterium]
MFYKAGTDDHGLERDPFKALVVPRPIGWVSSQSPEGVVNLAPYSYFNAVGDRPYYLVFSGGGFKDSERNILATGEFVCSLATYDLREAMNVTSASVEPGVDEFELAGLEKAASELVAPPRVAASPVHFECRLHDVMKLPGHDPAVPHYTMLIGEVLGIHLDEAVLTDGRVDIRKMRPIARLGYMDYAVVDDFFS